MPLVPGFQEKVPSEAYLRQLKNPQFCTLLGSRAHIWLSNCEFFLYILFISSISDSVTSFDEVVKLNSSK